MGSAQNVGKAFFPLDEELELIAGRLTPHAHECLVRFGAWIPFERAQKELEFVLKICVSEPTARRYTQEAGSAYEEYQKAEVERLEKEAPESPKGLKKMFFSTDGAFVPLVGGEWMEVKTLTIGEIEEPIQEKGEWVVHSREHSYFSRLEKSDVFERLALVETHRRGVENSQLIAGVTDGAEWEQGFMDYHCPNAVRILDFPHASQRICQNGQALWGEETEMTRAWCKDQLHRLKHHGPVDLFVELHRLQQQHSDLKILQDNLAYLEKRIGHMQYPQYQQQGLPIGSGAMESANKIVVEARLNGAGMHWALSNVNPMLALRNVLCSDRWEEAWPMIASGLRQKQYQHRKSQHRKRKAAKVAIDMPQFATPLPYTPVDCGNDPQPPNLAHPESIPDTVRGPSKPAANHPWRNSPIGKARFLPPKHFSKN
jgi:hypothetical protein